MKNEELGIPMSLVGSILIIFGLALMFFLATTSIGAGERGVRTTFGEVEQLSLAEGLHFKIPIVQNIHVIDTKTLKVESGASAASKDLQVVSTVVALNFRIKPDSAHSLFQQIGTDYQSKVIDPAIQEAVKATTAQFTAEQLVTQRQLVRSQIENRLKEKLVTRHLEVQNVSITDFDFSDQFNVAIEAKVTAEQDAFKAVNELERIKIEAEQRVTQAKAESDSKKLQADAEAYQKTQVADAEAYRIELEGLATAEAFRVINEQLSTNLVELERIKAWDGSVPTYSGIGGTPLIDLRAS